MSAPNTVPAERVSGLYMEPRELHIVHDILQSCISQRKVWAFGSRATGVRLKRFSDLDLAIEGKLTLAEGARLAEDFDESPLPFKVDILSLDTMDESFRHRIEPDFIAVQ